MRSQLLHHVKSLLGRHLRLCCRLRCYSVPKEGNVLFIKTNASAASCSLVRFFTISQGFNGKVVPFLLSDIGEGIREVTVKEWFVKEGDHVNQFDQICEVQSDKASVTITSRYDGFVKKKYYQVDETAFVGSPLVDIELSEGAHDSHAHDQVDDITGTHLASQVVSELHSVNEESTGTLNFDKVLATPAVRRLASENKVKLSEVISTGKDGRVLKEDVLAYLAKYEARKPTPPQMPQLKTEPTPAVEKACKPQQASAPVKKAEPTTKEQPLQVKDDTIITLKGIRKGMAASMNEALKIPHFGYCDEIDMSALVKLRKQLKGSPMLGSIPFSYMPVIIKACSLALKEFPILNSSLLPSGDQVLLKAAHNIGFAMDSPDGLIVPNIKNVQNLSVLDIAQQMHRLISLGENGKLALDDISGGTFSLSNIGSIGGTYAKPVILPPQVAIGALGKIQVLPRFDENDNVIKMHIMNVSWSADHRVVEGAQMARFSNLWKSYLENPAKLILHMK